MTDEIKLVSRVERTLYRFWICDLNGCDGEMLYTGHAVCPADDAPPLKAGAASSMLYVHRCSKCDRIARTSKRYPLSEPLTRQLRAESSLNVNRVRVRLADKPDNAAQNLLDLCRALDEIELQRLTPTVDVHDTLAYLLDVHFFLDQLRPKIPYERNSDGNLNKLTVCFDEEGRAILSCSEKGTATFSPGSQGGQSRRTRTALLILAEAIRLDNLQTPIKKRK